MIAQDFKNQFTIKYGPSAQTAIELVISTMGVSELELLGAESLAVKFMELFTLAEKNLPDTLKQNNFGYGIGEGGAYRGTIKATVSTALQVIG